MQTATTCPACGADQVVPIEYGFPGGEMVEDFESGKIELGGCSITDNDPAWACRACDLRWD